MQITQQWLNENKTPRGGYRIAQLRLIGVRWPPAPGWKRAVVGTEITPEEARKFEGLAKS